jgi:hypothetical protein
MDYFWLLSQKFTRTSEEDREIVQTRRLPGSIFFIRILACSGMECEGTEREVSFHDISRIKMFEANYVSFKALNEGEI